MFLCRTQHSEAYVAWAWHAYEDGGPALVLIAQNGEVHAVASVNMVNAERPEGHVYIKNWAENAGILESLERAGIVKRTGAMAPAGFCEAHLCKITDPSFR